MTIPNNTNASSLGFNSYTGIKIRILGVFTINSNLSLYKCTLESENNAVINFVNSQA